LFNLKQHVVRETARRRKELENVQNRVMEQKKILVPLGEGAKHLRCVHYALSLADRIPARIYVLRQKELEGNGEYDFDLLDQALNELIENARQNGVSLSFYKAGGNLVDEIVAMVNAEQIGLLIFNADDELSETVMSQVRTLVSSQIIEVREKE